MQCRAAFNAQLFLVEDHLEQQQAAQYASTEPESTAPWNEQEGSSQGHKGALKVRRESLGAAWRLPPQLATRAIELRFRPRDQQGRVALPGLSGSKLQLACLFQPGLAIAQHSPTLITICFTRTLTFLLACGLVTVTSVPFSSLFDCRQFSPAPLARLPLTCRLAQTLETDPDATASPRRKC